MDLLRVAACRAATNGIQFMCHAAPKSGHQNLAVDKVRPSS